MNVARNTLWLFCSIIGLGIIAVALGSDFLGIGGQGFGARQVMPAVGGFALLLGGVTVALPARRRRAVEWLLVGTAGLAVVMAADLIHVGGVFGGARPFMMVLVGCSILLSRVAQTWADGQRHMALRECLGSLVSDKRSWGKFVGIAVQIGLLMRVVGQYHLVDKIFYGNMMALTFYAFLVHYLLPFQSRLPFFLLVSLAPILWLLGPAHGLCLLGIGLGLIGICHLPLAFRTRVAILLIAAALLTALRANILHAPWLHVIWPILASMFMFRLLIYLYDLKHQRGPATLFGKLSYFFLFPNVTFFLFPVVDSNTFQRTYYDADQHQIYQRGVQWIFRGVVHLILYRIINHYLAISPTEVADVGDLIRFLVSNFLLYLRVSGQFHLIVGILHLFGFHLPETNHLYCFASSFTDLWRRINIYWKDFMLKIFYYPSYVWLRRWGLTTSMVLSTLIVFVATWFLHAYQLFWLRGSFVFSLVDVLFWTILALLVLYNALSEAKRGRQRTLGAQRWTLGGFASHGLRVVGTFAVVCVLWSLWTSSSLSDWFSLWSVAIPKFEDVAMLSTFLGVGIVLGGVFQLGAKGQGTIGTRRKPPTFLQSTALTGVLICLLYLIGEPAIYLQFGEKAAKVIRDLKLDKLTEREARLLERGYYENILQTNQSINTRFWEVQRLHNWVGFPGRRYTGDFLKDELRPLIATIYGGAPLRTNRWGMRDQDYEQRALPDTYRIALIGPSHVMGAGVADHETFEALLEDRLNHEHAGKAYARYESLNFGVPGYSPLQELMVIEQKAFSFDPNAIFFVSHPDEGYVTIRHLQERVRKGIDVPYADLRDIVRRANIDKRTTEVVALRRLGPFSNDILAWTYRRIVDMCRQRGILPVWVFLPLVEDRQQDPALFRLAEEAGFILVDLSGVYENQDVNSIRFAEWERHPNVEGHKLIANRLYESLLAQAILPLEKSAAHRSQ